MTTTTFTHNLYRKQKNNNNNFNKTLTAGITELRQLINFKIIPI